jgi:uncharacterized protein YjbJ (UPF0337 family)
VNKLMKTEMGRNLVADALVATASGIIGTRYVREQAAAVAGEVREQAGNVAGNMMDTAENLYDTGFKKKKKKKQDDLHRTH